MEDAPRNTIVLELTHITFLRKSKLQRPCALSFHKKIVTQSSIGQPLKTFNASIEVLNWEEDPPKDVTPIPIVWAIMEDSLILSTMSYCIKCKSTYNVHWWILESMDPWMGCNRSFLLRLRYVLEKAVDSVIYQIVTPTQISHCVSSRTTPCQIISDDFYW